MLPTTISPDFWIFPLIRPGIVAASHSTGIWPQAGHFIQGCRAPTQGEVGSAGTAGVDKARNPGDKWRDHRPQVQLE